MKTLIIGASTNPQRYSYLAAQRLLKAGHEIEMIGSKADEIHGQPIFTDKLPFSGINTVTLYVNTKIQPNYYDYILSLHPRRVIFNPGTENPAFEETLRKQGIEAVEACTLVLLSIGNY